MQIIKGITMRRNRTNRANRAIHGVTPAAITNGLKAAANPLRMLSVGSYWAEFDEPIQLLDDPLGTFAADAKALITLCERHNILYIPGQEPAFPVWLLREFYPSNP
ncbi:hypothetical protein [Tardiphaga sp. 619_E2_N8_5]|uniref:hypothetical protein n=1 Tax=unclassified Tardiphaga TaxID=2631404 RepID=UPI003F1F92E3